MFRRDLRKQYTAVIFRGDHQTVLADLDFPQSDREKLGKYGDLDFQPGCFFPLQRRKARIVEGCALRAVDDALSQRFARFNHADTAAKSSEDLECYKHSLS